MKTLEWYQKNYKSGAWREYSFTEFGQWIDLLVKRSTHRVSNEKRDEDINHAKNYLALMEARLDEISEE